MISLRALTPAQLESLLEKSRVAAPTYLEIGASRSDALPRGFHHVRVEERIGDAAVFERAGEGLRTWVAHEGAGLRIYPHDPVTPDATVIAITSVGFFRVVAPCRIVAVFKDPDSFGFTYGTLPGHPERGEESFVLTRRDGATYFAITAFSTPAELVARIGAPFSRAVQRTVTRKYVKALRRFVESE